MEWSYERISEFARKMQGPAQLRPVRTYLQAKLKRREKSVLGREF